jgi:hypothetical protein
VQRDWLNAVTNLEYRDPAPFLKRLRELETKVALSNLPRKVRALRTNTLKEWRQAREAALFCVGMGQRLGQVVWLAKSEESDYDFVASWVTADIRHFAPVQLKEVVPTEINPTASIEATIDALPRKYVDSAELTVAVYLNQQVHFDPSKVKIPNMRIGSLWVFGGLAPDASEWGLWGDFLDQPQGTRFTYPA